MVESRHHELMESSMHNVASDFYGSSDEETRTHHDRLVSMTSGTMLAQEKWKSRKMGLKNSGYVKKRALFWRTIIFSALGKTLYPYSQYIRTLDLQRLAELLKDPQFKKNRTFK